MIVIRDCRGNILGRFGQFLVASLGDALLAGLGILLHLGPERLIDSSAPFVGRYKPSGQADGRRRAPLYGFLVATTAGYSRRLVEVSARGIRLQIC